MRVYLALLRGINVGGNALIKMAELQQVLSDAGLQNVTTYIQSGNVIFESKNKDNDALAALISQTIKQSFGLDVKTAVFSREEWRAIIKAAPDWWGVDKGWKHNMLIMIKPFVMDKVVQAIGQLKPGIELMVAGNGILYQSVSFKMFGRATTGKLASNPVYKSMTIRNYNTATKLLTVLDKQ